MNRIIKSLILLSACFSLGYVNRISGKLGIRWKGPLSAFAYFPCDDNANNTTVRNLYGTDGTNDANTDLKHAGGPNGYSLYYDGSDDFTDLNDNPNDYAQEEFEIKLWIKFQDGQPASVEVFYGKYVVNTDFFQLTLLTDGKLQCNYKASGNQSVARTSDAVFSDGLSDWTLISAVVAPAGITISVNDNILDLDPSYPGDMSGVTMADFDCSESIYIGARNEGPADTYHCNCNIADFAINPEN